jgi:hypothetical protein
VWWKFLVLYTSPILQWPYGRAVDLPAGVERACLVEEGRNSSDVGETDARSEDESRLLYATADITSLEAGVDEFWRAMVMMLVRFWLVLLVLCRETWRKV